MGTGPLATALAHTVGTLELWCISRDNKQKWKLEFNVRERAE